MGAQEALVFKGASSARGTSNLGEGGRHDTAKQVKFDSVCAMGDLTIYLTEFWHLFLFNGNVAL